MDFEDLPDDVKVAAAFASLELLELRNNRRELTQCPGIENLARACAEARKKGAGAHTRPEEEE